MKKAQKLLTVKIEQDDQVIQKILYNHNNLTIGRNPDNDVILYGDQYPRKHILFARKDHYYEIRLKKYMEGEVKVGDSSLAFRDLILHRLLPRKGDNFFYPLTQDKEGYIVINGVKISFKFEQVKAVPGEDFKAYSWFYATYKDFTRDLFFKVILILMLIFHGAILRYMQVNFSNFVPRISVRQVPERFAKFIIKKSTREESRKIIAEKATRAEETSKEAEASKTEKKSASKSKSSPKNLGLLGLLGGTGETAHSSSMIDFLLDKGLVKEIEDVMSNSDLKIGKGNSNSDISDIDEWLSLSEVNSGIDDIIGGDVNEVESVNLGKKGQVKIERVGKIKGNAAAVGQRSEESVRSVLLAYMGRLKYIYEKYLKRNPDFAGKMVVEVTIEANGRVSNVKVISSNLNNPQFEAEIVNVIRRWKYEPISQGVVTVTYPLVFNKIE